MLLRSTLFVLCLLWNSFAFAEMIFGGRGEEHSHKNIENLTYDQKMSLYAERANVRIRNYVTSHYGDAGEGYGSGFFISPQMIVTNSHVVYSAGHTTSKLYKFISVWLNSAVHIAVVVAEDLKNDLAIAKVIGSKTKNFLDLNKVSTTNVGDKVSVFKSDVVFFAQYINEVLDVNQHPPFNIIHIKGPSQPGTSGSSVLSDDSNLIGVAFATTEDKTLVVPVEKLKNFIQDNFFVLNAMGYKHTSFKKMNKIVQRDYIKTYFKTKQDVDQFNAYIKKQEEGIENNPKAWMRANLHHPLDSQCEPGGWPLDLKWRHQLAKNGHPFMQLLMGLAYEEGEAGLKINKTKARYWFKKAARQGVTSSKYRLGRDYRKRNKLHKALRYLKQAEKDEPKAKNQIELGHTYEQLKQPRQALYWYKKAAASGDQHAPYHVNILQKSAP